MISSVSVAVAVALTALVAHAAPASNAAALHQLIARQLPGNAPTCAVQCLGFKLGEQQCASLSSLLRVGCRARLTSLAPPRLPSDPDDQPTDMTCTYSCMHGCRPRSPVQWTLRLWRESCSLALHSDWLADLDPPFPSLTTRLLARLRSLPRPLAVPVRLASLCRRLPRLRGVLVFSLRRGPTDRSGRRRQFLPLVQ